MTTTWNSVAWESSWAPAGTADWEKIMAITNRITRAHGLGQVKLIHDGETMSDDPTWEQELTEKYGTADPQRLWWWDGTAHSGTQWLSVYISNVARDGTGRAAEEQVDASLAPSYVSISYGVTTVSRADRAALESALEPFAELTPPTPSTSD